MYGQRFAESIKQKTSQVSYANRWLPTIFLILLLISAALIARSWSSAKPLYGHVVFGPESNPRLQVIVVEEHVYIDRNSDDAPQSSELVGKNNFSKPVELKSADGLTRYTVSGSLKYAQQALSKTRTQELSLDVDIVGPAQFSQYGDVILSNQRSHPGIAHFDGPLAIRLRTPNLHLVSGTAANHIRVEVSTHLPEQGGWVAVYSNKRGDRRAYAFSAEVAPRIEVEFPTGSHDEPPIKMDFALDQFC